VVSTKKNVKQHRAQTFLALVIIIRKNVPCAPNQHIRMSFEGSCDTKTGVMMLCITEIHFRWKTALFNCF